MNYQKEKAKKKSHLKLHQKIKLHQKRVKYLGIHLTKYSELYMKLMKETEDDTKNRLIFCVHGLEELTLLKCTYYPKQSTESMQPLSRYSWHF